MDKQEWAQETRRRNQEARQKQREARETEERADKALILDALRAVLKDPEATTAQRLYAVAVLDNMKYYRFAPYGVKHPGQGPEVDLTRFKEEIDKQL